jgi:hypothetical protein
LPAPLGGALQRCTIGGGTAEWHSSEDTLLAGGRIDEQGQGGPAPEHPLDPRRDDLAEPTSGILVAGAARRHIDRAQPKVRETLAYHRQALRRGRESTRTGDNAEERRDRRQIHSRPILDDLRAWIDHQKAITPPKTPLGQELGYVDRQWTRLRLFLDDGNIEATNNRRERELRRLILGRKSWLFTWLDEVASGPVTSCRSSPHASHTTSTHARTSTSSFIACARMAKGQAPRALARPNAGRPSGTLCRRR